MFLDGITNPRFYSRIINHVLTSVYVNYTEKL